MFRGHSYYFALLVEMAIFASHHHCGDGRFSLPNPLDTMQLALPLLFILILLCPTSNSFSKALLPTASSSHSMPYFAPPIPLRRYKNLPATKLPQFSSTANPPNPLVTTISKTSFLILPTLFIYILSTPLINILPPLTPNDLKTDVSLSLLCSILATIWLKAITYFAMSGKLSASDARKIIHTGSAPLFMIFWPFFSSATVTSQLLAACVPFANILKLLSAGFSQSTCASKCTALQSVPSGHPAPPKLAREPHVLTHFPPNDAPRHPPPQTRKKWLKTRYQQRA